MVLNEKVVEGPDSSRKCSTEDAERADAARKQAPAASAALRAFGPATLHDSFSLPSKPLPSETCPIICPIIVTPLMKLAKLLIHF
jgi:hypothetical protein